MKGIYIYYSEISMERLSGIDKKVLWQLEEFNKNGLSCKLKIIENKIKNNRQRVWLRFPFANIAPKWEYFEEFNNIDFLYLRRPNVVTGKMISILKRIKKSNKNLKIIYEIPTYPYDGELKIELRNYPLLLKDRYNRRKLHLVVDRIAVQISNNDIFGIPILNFANGIKIDDISIRKPYEHKENIEICAVASMASWQGYERVIKSLSKYYKEGGKKNILIHFVGTGIELNKYKELVKKFQLEGRIVFHGFLTGDKLEKIYNLSDLALDAFGRYKTNNPISTSLKSREYLAKGIPVISGSKSDLFNKENEYYLEFASDDSVFDFKEVIKFYEKIYQRKSKKLVANEVRKFANEVCDISKTMNNITSYIIGD